MTLLILKIIINMVKTNVDINTKTERLLVLMLYNSYENKENEYLTYIMAVESVQLMEMTDSATKNQSGDKIYIVLFLPNPTINSFDRLTGHHSIIILTCERSFCVRFTIKKYYYSWKLS